MKKSKDRKSNKKSTMKCNVFLLATLGFSTASAAAQLGNTIDVFVVWKNEAGKAALHNAAVRKNCKDKFNTSCLTVNITAIDGLCRNPNIESVTPDAELVFPDEIEPADLGGIRKRKLANYGLQYGLVDTQVDQLLEAHGQGTSVVKVCVVDSGYALGHSDLPGNSAEGGPTDCATGSDPESLARFGSWATDENGHGSMVSGIISMLGNGFGYVGVNPTCNKDESDNSRFEIISCKATNSEGVGTSASYIKAIDDCCIPNGANIINLSIGTVLDTGYTERFRGYYEDDNLLVVAASGNNGPNTHFWPAQYPHVISVGAVFNDRLRNVIWPGSTTNTNVELVAPGIAIQSTFPGGGYRTGTGTSFASPHVAGIA
jgi:subtilisin family serine protease